MAIRLRKKPPRSPLRQALDDVLGIPEKPGLARSRAQKASWITLLMVIVAAGSIYGFTHIGYASTTEFYPSTCLGSWRAPNNATGEPDVKNENERDSFTSDNSAIVGNEVGNIYCGGFHGKIPDETRPTAIEVHFSWTIKNASQNAAVPTTFNPPVEATSTTASSSSSEGDTASSSSDTSEPASDSVDQNSDETPSTDTVPTAAPEPEPSAPATTPTPDSSSPAPASASDEPVSLRQESISHYLVQTAYAQETTGTESSSSTVSTSSTASLDSSSIPPAEAPAGALLQVRYTTDGVVWNDLGSVTESQLQGATFNIPTTGLASWEDLSKLQVSVQTVTTLDAPTVYLDSVWLSISYEKGEVKEVQPVIFTDLSPATDHTVLRTHDDETSDQKLIIGSLSDSLQGVAVYRDDLPGVPFVHTYVDDTYYIVAASSFPVGKYRIVITADPNHCSTESFDVCRSTSQYIDTVLFSVASSSASLLSSSSPPEAPSASTQ